MPGLRDILDAATRECAPEDVACNFQRDWANEVLADRNHEIVALVLDMGEELRAWVAEFPESNEAVALLARLDRLGKEPSDG